jgi:hypothetical protein
VAAVARGTLRVEGLAELVRAFSLTDKKEQELFRDARRAVAEPVRADAQLLASSSIHHIGIPWSQMRVGLTRTSIYVAPRQRGSRGRGRRHRPNLADLLMNRALQPALDRNIANAEKAFDDMLVDVANFWEKA